LQSPARNKRRGFHDACSAAGKNTTGRLWVAWQMVWPGRVLALYVLFYPFSKAVQAVFLLRRKKFTGRKQIFA